MSSRAPTKKERSATKPRQKMQGHTGGVNSVLHLSDKRRTITGSWDGSLRVWDLESGTQVGDAWQDEGSWGVQAIALSPDGKKVASGSLDGAVRLWEIDTGKVIKKWKGHTHGVQSICWSPDGGRVVSGSQDKTFRVWDVKSGQTIIGPIDTGDNIWVYAVCYSPDGTMIATGGDKLEVWDANTGELLKTLDELVFCLAWTSDGKTLMAGSSSIKKFDTATWTETAVLDGHQRHVVYGISLSPNERILASASSDKTARLWDLQTNQPIGPPLHHEDTVKSAALSADGKFLATGCNDNRIYTWDVSVILREAGLHDLLLENVNTVKKSGLHADATRRRPPQIDGARRLPPGFFDDFSTPHGRRGHRTTAQHQRTLLSHLPSFLRRRSDPRRATERATQSPSHPRTWAKNLVSGALHRQHGSDIQLREPPVVDVPCTRGKPRNYHARGKQAAKSSQRPSTHTTQQHNGAAQSTLSSIPQPSATATTSTSHPADVATAGTTGTISRPHLTIRDAGWRARFMLWVCCVPVQNTDGQH